MSRNAHASMAEPVTSNDNSSDKSATIRSRRKSIMHGPTNDELKAKAKRRNSKPNLARQRSLPNVKELDFVDILVNDSRFAQKPKPPKKEVPDKNRRKSMNPDMFRKVQEAQESKSVKGQRRMSKRPSVIDHSLMQNGNRSPENHKSSGITRKTSTTYLEHVRTGIARSTSINRYDLGFIGAKEVVNSVIKVGEESPSHHVPSPPTQQSSRIEEIKMKSQYSHPEDLGAFYIDVPDEPNNETISTNNQNLGHQESVILVHEEPGHNKSTPISRKQSRESDSDGPYYIALSQLRSISFENGTSNGTVISDSRVGRQIYPEGKSIRHEIDT